MFMPPIVNIIKKEADKAIVNVKVLKNFDVNLGLPEYKTRGAAGADIKACLKEGLQLIIHPGDRVCIPTGLSMSIPEGYEIQVRPRSGISIRTGLLVVDSPGTIDSDYRGEIKITLGNFGTEDEIIKHGDRIAQLILTPVSQAVFDIVNNLDTTERGEGGFGSTGV